MSKEITEITTGLKALAKELNVPIIALSQQDADVVLFVFREEYYLKNKEPRPGTEEHLKWETDLAAARGKAEIIIGKQRHGPTGTVMLSFQGEFTRFADLAEDRF